MVRVCEKYCYPNNFIVKSQKRSLENLTSFFMIQKTPSKKLEF